MTERALIVSLDDSKITAMHFEKEECATCTTGCAKTRTTFEISNPKDFPLKKGSVVLIQASRKIQAVQGLCSLFIPFLCSILGYAISPALMEKFGVHISNDFRAVFVLLFLFVSSAIVFIVTRKFPVPGKPEIAEVL